MNGTLHIVVGDSVGGKLAAPHMAIWRDVLCEGPVPRTEDDAEFLRVRANYLASLGLDARDDLEEFQAKIDRYSDYSEVVIWCEYDLLDQVVLLRVLEWFGRHPPCATKLSLIDAGSHLGPLAKPELDALFEKRQPVTPAQLALAREAWEAYTAEDPRGIVELLRRNTSALPYLDGAMRRHLEEFPSERTGHSRTEETALRIWNERGPMDWRKLFVAVQAEEERPFLGDTSFLRIWTELQDGRRAERWLGGARADRPLSGSQ